MARARVRAARKAAAAAAAGAGAGGQRAQMRTLRCGCARTRGGRRRASARGLARTGRRRKCRRAPNRPVPRNAAHKQLRCRVRRVGARWVLTHATGAELAGAARLSAAQLPPGLSPTHPFTPGKRGGPRLGCAPRIAREARPPRSAARALTRGRAAGASGLCWRARA